MGLEYISSAFSRKKLLNLALQGGGAHGAFTWGALDRLIEHEDLRIDGVSGASAGAVNAVALAAGLMEGGPGGAKKKLSEVWKKIGKAGSLAKLVTFPVGLLWPNKNITDAAQKAMQTFTQHLSPYDFNPMDINPLRNILKDAIDFDALRKHSPVKLFISATNVSSGRARIFTNDDITVEAVLASTCLPALFKAIVIDGENYWDGGYSSNPDLLSLIEGTSANDTLLVQLNPTTRHELPTSQAEILENIDRITFNQPLIHEIEIIYRFRRRGGLLAGDKTERRYQNMRFHLINASDITEKMDYQSKLSPEKEVLQYLFKSGKKHAGSWLENNVKLVGRQSSANLLEEFA